MERCTICGFLEKILIWPSMWTSILSFAYLYWDNVKIVTWLESIGLLQNARFPRIHNHTSLCCNSLSTHEHISNCVILYVEFEFSKLSCQTTKRCDSKLMKFAHIFFIEFKFFFRNSGFLWSFEYRKYRY